MAKIGTDFSEIPNGDPLIGNGFTDRWVAISPSTLTAETLAASVDGGRVARFASADGVRRQAVSWDAAGNVEFGRLFVRLRAPTSLDNLFHMLHVFGGGAATTETGMFLQFNPTSNVFRFDKYTSGTIDTSLTTEASITGTGDARVDWVNLLLDFSDDPVIIKAWFGHRVTDEPISPTMSITRSDIAISSAGWISLQAAFNGRTREYDFLGLGTGADDAPRQMADLDTGTVPAGTTTISAVEPNATTAEVTYSYDESDQTGFEYRIDGGDWAAIDESPATITGLTESTSYNSPGIEVRAVNGSGAGTPSNAVAFSTTEVQIISTAVKLSLNDEAGDPIPNMTGLRYVLSTARTPDQVTDANIIAQGADGTTDGSGVFSVASGTDNVGAIFGVAVTTATGTTGEVDNHRGTWRVVAAEEI